jgi:hypothetical protein
VTCVGCASFAQQLCHALMVIRCLMAGAWGTRRKGLVRYARLATMKTERPASDE